MADFLDTFTATDNAALLSHTSDSGGTYAAATSFGSSVATIVSNRAIGAAANQLFRTSGSPADADYSVTGRFLFKTNTTDHYGVMVRVQAAAQEWYSLTYQNGVFNLYKNAASGLDSVSGTLTADDSYDLTIEASGSATTALKCRVRRVSDGKWLIAGNWVDRRLRGNCISVSDSSSPVTAAGSAGIWLGTSNGSSTGLMLDELTASDDPISGEFIAIDDAAIFYSLGNWAFSGSDYAITVNTGAYAKFNFPGTSVHVKVDVSAQVSGSVSAADYPKLIYEIDGVVQDHLQLTSWAEWVELAQGLTDGPHTLKLYFGGCNPLDYDRWTPVMALKVTGFMVDAGKAISAPTTYSRRMLVYGDSQGEGFDAISLAGGVAAMDPTRAYPMLLAAERNAEVTVVCFASQGYTADVPTASVPNLEDAWDFKFSGQSRLTGGEFAETYDEILCCHGQNDAGDVTAVVTALAAAWRTAAPTTPIYFCRPPSGEHSTEIAAGVAAASDANVIYVDTGEDARAPEGNANGVHLSLQGQEYYVSLLVAQLPAVSGGGGFFGGPAGPFNKTPFLF